MQLQQTSSTHWWSRFAARHLHDYNAPAIRLWLGIVGCGAAVGLWSVLHLAQSATLPWAAIALATAMAVLASWVPVRIPRSKTSFTVSDFFLFYLLLSHGPAAAALAAGVEGAFAAVRTSQRLSSRLSTPAAALVGFAAAGLVLEHTRLLLAPWLRPEVAAMVGLCIAAFLPFVCTTLPLTSLLALKRGRSVSLRQWWHQCSWFGAIYLGSAMAAAIAHMNTLQFGPTALVTTVLVVFAIILLLRVSLERQEAEHQAQEVRLRDAQREAELGQLRFTASFTHAGVGMAIVNPEGHVVQVNKALCRLLKSTEASLLGHPFSAFLHDGDVDLFSRTLRDATQREEQAFSIELRCITPTGDEPWVTLHCSQFDDPGHLGTFRIYQLHDITSQREAESRLQHIAYHDSLTDLANRNCFGAALTVAVERSRSDANIRFAVMFLDLDRFKIVNDSLGHLAGNELLREVAHRLRRCVRPSDLVARLGGDEFAILLNAVSSIEMGTRLAERVLEALTRPVSINGTELIPGASIGITFSDLGYRTVDEVLRDADLAMYEAKGAGRGRVVVFDQSMHERIADKLALEADLRKAIGAGQLSVVFQPIFDLDPYRLSGFEALARWEHPERGPISPSVFIALAEESGRIEALTRWVIDHAVAQLAQWLHEMPSMSHLDMHVNISSHDLTRPGLVEHVQQVLTRHGLPAHHLTLEITETMLMNDLEVSLGYLQGLRDAGIRFSIDDFGTGYSSLAYLSTLPLDSLKIDRSFVMGMEALPQNVEIVRAVMNLGKSLGKTVIAEGIEQPQQLQILRSLGVPRGQGYLLSKPLKAEQVPALLAVPARSAA
ncbi:putative bifunctional diguanylate cyclase/phosphodiesterase [Ideonella paludis]|uniref:EAL domain-containing protein n=1 Tax=Ideonella paludis TaxID=1233411 RepID=A0ABS5DTZ2_9BURK|nr:EAL domain-containing protein [Ideonella paludis]MBQ0934613.1 EAL domain-containing protein [Ideonella paludis]